MRGKHSVKTDKQAQNGITPADAGKTRHNFATVTKVGDHPRGCGENDGWQKKLEEQAGITPADAGKTY